MRPLNDQRLDVEKKVSWKDQTTKRGLLQQSGHFLDAPKSKYFLESTRPIFNVEIKFRIKQSLILNKLSHQELFYGEKSFLF